MSGGGSTVNREPALLGQLSNPETAETWARLARAVGHTAE